MDEALLDGLIDQTKLGNRVGGTFTTTAYDNLCTELKKQFPHKNVTKTKIINHFKNMKKKFTPWFNVFKHGLSGFSWDPITCEWGAEPEVWNKLIEERPAALKLKNKSFPLYYKFVEVYGVDRATGENAQTAAEMRAKKLATNSLIEDVDKLVHENQISLENYVIYGVDGAMGENTSRSEKHDENAQKRGNVSENVQKGGNDESGDNCTTQSSSKRAKGKAKVIE